MLERKYGKLGRKGYNSSSHSSNSSPLIFSCIVIISNVRRMLKESISLNEINESYYLFNLNNFNQTKRRGRLNWQMLSGEIDSFKNDNQEGSIS